jgi:hypothetical protein
MLVSHANKHFALDRESLLSFEIKRMERRKNVPYISNAFYNYNKYIFDNTSTNKLHHLY